MSHEVAGLTRTAIITELSRSAHGKLAEYMPIVSAACKSDPEFLAHLLAFDFINGQIKDSKIALPVITVASRDFPDELVENSLAHLAMQPPRELLKSLRFSIETGAPARRQRVLEKTIRRYLAFKEREPGKWNRLAARHRRSLRELYMLTHCPMPEWASTALFGFVRTKEENEQHRKLRNLLSVVAKDGMLSATADTSRVLDEIRALKSPRAYPPGSIFADIAALRRMAPPQVAATIEKWHLSPLVVSGAMAGSKTAAGDSAVVQATMNQMSDTEVITRAKSLEKQGLSRDAALKDTFRKKVAGATKSKKATLKTSVAADEVEDESLKTMLKELQERQIQAQKDAGRGIDGNWLVISDRSISQDVAIELGVQISAAIAKFVTGKVWLVFCNQEAIPYDVTGLSLEAIKEKTKLMTAFGGTSYGVGLDWAMSKKLDLDGVVIVGDGGENSPPVFAHMLALYNKKHDTQLPVYLYRTYCEPKYAATQGGNPRNFGALMAQSNLTFTEHDLSHGKVDYYSIPNLVQSMNANRFGVVEKIMACPLVTLDQVLPQLVTAAR